MIYRCRKSQVMRKGGTVGSLFSAVRDPVEAVASLVGNYFVPGSSLITDQLVSKGAQSELDSPLGEVAQVGSGLAGAGVGSSITGIPESFGGTAEGNALSSIFGSGDPANTTANAASLDSSADANPITPLDASNPAAAAQATGGTYSAAPTAGGAGGGGGLSPADQSLLQNAGATPNNVQGGDAYNAAETASNATTPPPAQPTSIGGKIMSYLNQTIGSGATPGNANGATPGSGILGATGGVGGLLKDALLGGSLANQVIQGQRQTKGLNQLEQGASEGLTTETGLINSLQSGKLPPGAQATIDQQVADSITSIKSHYASLGMSGSSAETQDIAAANQAGVTAAFNYAQQATQTGLQALGENSSVYNSIMQSVLGQNAGLSKSLSALAGAGNPTGQTISLAANAAGS